MITTEYSKKNDNGRVIVREREHVSSCPAPRLLQRPGARGEQGVSLPPESFPAPETPRHAGQTVQELRQRRVVVLLPKGHQPGKKTSYLSFVTTSETKQGSALAKKGTDATKDRQL